MRSLPAVVLAAFCSVSFALACDSSQICSLEPVYSVTILVGDADGEPVLDAEVSYTLDGAGPVEAICAPSGDGCSGWYAGEDELGTFEITATSADGNLQDSATVEVSRREGCHVVGKKIDLVLE